MLDKPKFTVVQYWGTKAESFERRNGGPNNWGVVRKDRAALSALTRQLTS
jgi:hypothetical protein